MNSGLNGIAQPYIILFRGLANHLVDLGLGLVNQVCYFSLAFVAGLSNSGACLYKSPKDGLLGNNLGVVAGICRGRNVTSERVEVVRTACLHEVSLLV